LILQNKVYSFSLYIGEINELFGLRNANGLSGFLFIMLMLAFVGVPPLLGFYSKFYLLYFLWLENSFFLFFLFLFFSLLSAFYYIRIGRVFFNINDFYINYGVSSKICIYVSYIIFFVHIFFPIFLLFYFPMCFNFLILDII
jgi:NADH-quinone oxidoreductase subunit N